MGFNVDTGLEDFFVKNQADLVKKYQGKFIVIKNETVIGVFDDLRTNKDKDRELPAVLRTGQQTGADVFCLL